MKKNILNALSVFGWSAFGFASPTFACGTDSDCAMGDRVYRIYEPQKVSHPGAIIFAHGYRGSAKGIMKSKGFKSLADELGVPLIAAQAYAEDWRIPGVPSDPTNDGSLEYAYFAELRDTLKTRHNIDPDKTLLTGFSAGGMAVWQVACFKGDLFGAYAPIAGTFWDPMPNTCPSAPINLFHTHGTSDRTVPLAGRFVTNTVKQGDVPTALSMLQTYGDFPDMQPMPAAGELTCQGSTAPTGQRAEFCTHPGGHSVKASFVKRVWMQLSATGTF